MLVFCFGGLQCQLLALPFYTNLVTPPSTRMKWANIGPTEALSLARRWYPTLVQQCFAHWLCNGPMSSANIGQITGQYWLANIGQMLASQYWAIYGCQYWRLSEDPTLVYNTVQSWTCYLFEPTPKITIYTLIQQVCMASASIHPTGKHVATSLNIYP